MKLLFEEFLKKISYRNKSLDLTIFNEETWFNSVWNTLNGSFRTTNGTKSSDYIKNDIKKELFSLILSIETDFENSDSWYRKNILKLNDDFKLSIGRSQKILNLIIKYYLGNFYLSNNPQKIGHILNENIQRLHIPIDSIILKNLNNLYRDKDIDIRRILNSTHNLITQKNPSSWSKLEDIESYIEFQKYIQSKTKEFSLNPIELEMKYLWISDKELIKSYVRNNRNVKDL